MVSQRDRVVASFAALAATGRLSARELQLDVAEYEPAIHFDQVKDRRFGLESRMESECSRAEIS